MPQIIVADREAIRRRAWEAVATVVDPEIPQLTIEDLGVLREVRIDDNGHVEVDITPTYSGCPAMDAIRFDVEVALARAGLEDARVRVVLSPAWTTDWMSEAGKAKLAQAGIAPPQARAGRRALFGIDSVACPRCGSGNTEEISYFGSTSCKSLWRCRACAEPFDHFRCI